MTYDYRFRHLALVATRYDETVRWYTRHFGFTVAREWTFPEALPGARLCYLQRGAFCLGVAGPARALAVTPGGDDALRASARRRLAGGREAGVGIRWSRRRRRG